MPWIFLQIMSKYILIEKNNNNKTHTTDQKKTNTKNTKNII